MEAAAIMAIVLALIIIIQGKPSDWQDFVGIITLLVINSTISFIEENNAGNAAAALMARLAPKAKDLPTTVFLLVKLTQRHLRLPGISMRRSGEWGDHLTLQAAADKIYLLSFPKNWISLNLTNNLYACLFLCILCMTMIEEHASISLK
ncbi:uncharacterized protein [Arachis hypogaea]|uniref:uncharacterized protein isoform X4 n=1 Tax=Arachis hypogaea TaxID=3818 RepID=UPI003B20CC2B